MVMLLPRGLDDVGWAIEQIEKDRKEKGGQCESPNPALVCFASGFMDIARQFLAEADTPEEGLMNILAHSVDTGIYLAKEYPEWSLLAHEQLEGEVLSQGAPPNSSHEVQNLLLDHFLRRHEMQHINQEQDITREKAENERAHLQEVDAAYEAGKAASHR